VERGDASAAAALDPDGHPLFHGVPVFPVIP